MIRVVSLGGLTDEGARQLLGDPTVFAETLWKVREIVVGFGGTLEQTWQTAGIYDFLSVATFPDLETEFRTRNAVTQLGVVRVDHVPAIPIEEALGLVES
jgi:uncharacterized protein with GYD domain